MDSSDLYESLLAHEQESHPKTWHNTPSSLINVCWESVKPVPCFSLATLLSAVDNDRDFAVEILELVLAQTPAEVQAIGKALETNDLATISRIIHSQKASFQVLGLTEVVRLGQAAEALIVANKAGTEMALSVTQYVQMLDAELLLIRTSLQSVR